MYDSLTTERLIKLILDNHTTSEIAMILQVSESGIKGNVTAACGKQYNVVRTGLRTGTIKPDKFSRDMRKYCAGKASKQKGIIAAARASQNKMLVTVIDERINELRPVKPKSKWLAWLLGK